MEYKKIDVEKELGMTLDEMIKILSEMDSEMDKVEIPVIEKTPEMIEKNPDAISREKELKEFTLLHDLYITPLSELAKRVCLIRGLSFSEIPSFSNQSVMGRLSKLREFLILMGCTPDTITNLVPKSPKEIQLLAYAHKNGFDLGYNNVTDLSNNNRLERAKEFLVTNVIKKTNTSYYEVYGYEDKIM